MWHCDNQINNQYSFVWQQHHLVVINILSGLICGVCKLLIKMPVICSGHSRVEHWPPQHTAGYGGAGVWHRHWGCQHSLPLFWHVEDHIRLAHWGHGSLQHQLPALWTVQVLVSPFFFFKAFCAHSPTTCHFINLGLVHRDFCHFCLKDKSVIKLAADFWLID